MVFGQRAAVRCCKSVRMQMSLATADADSSALVGTPVGLSFATGLAIVASCFRQLQRNPSDAPVMPPSC